MPGVHGDMAARHLTDRGFRRIVFLGLQDDRNSAVYEQGLRPSLKNQEIEIDARLIPQSHQSGEVWHATRRTLTEWVKTWSPPVGVLATDDLLVRYLASICMELGLRIPDDVALIGMGNNETICESMEPTLSSIEHGYERVGHAAAELLDQLMQGKPAPEAPTLIPPAELVARRSTDVFAVEDRLVARALRVIWDRGHRPIGVDDIVEALPVTRRSLERRFRKVLGRSIHDEITRSRVERAKRLLVETDDAIGAVAFEAGFTNAEHLAKVFRRIEKTTPRAFRKRHAGG